MKYKIVFNFFLFVAFLVMFATSSVALFLYVRNEGLNYTFCIIMQLIQAIIFIYFYISDAITKHKSSHK